jgi:hypothetical protein
MRNYKKINGLRLVQVVALGLLAFSLHLGANANEAANVARLQQLTCIAQHLYDARAELINRQFQNFSVPNASGLALLSTLAYENPEYMATTAKNLGFTKVIHFHHTENDLTIGSFFAMIWGKLSPHQRMVVADTNAYWLESDNLIVVDFTGTDATNIRNLVTDAMEKPVPMGKLGSVHSGFYGAVTIIWEDIYKEYLKVGNSKPMIFTGHSLGGALATLAAVQFLEEEERDVNAKTATQPRKTAIPSNKPYVAALYTFGSPEVGDEIYQATANGLLFNSRHILVDGDAPGTHVLASPAYSARFINANDPITDVPGYPMYRHIWNPILLNGTGTLIPLGGFPMGVISRYDNPLVKSVPDALKQIEVGVKYHMPINYLGKLLEASDPQAVSDCQVNSI